MAMATVYAAMEAVISTRKRPTGLAALLPLEMINEKMRGNKGVWRP